MTISCKENSLSGNEPHSHIMKFSKKNYIVKLHQGRVQRKSFNDSISLLILCSVSILIHLVDCQTRAVPSTSSNSVFPGVSRDLASFCAARPSLSIDLASMVVHVKKNISFNYKLYLFSTDYVFQTGQVIPRDDFRIHSFPVKLKHLSEFWPVNVPTYQFKQASADSLTLVPSTQFDLKQFFSLVPLYPPKYSPTNRHPSLYKPKRLYKSANSRRASRIPEDAHGDLLPGDPTSDQEFISHDVAAVIEAKTSPLDGHDEMHPSDENFNKNIQFDRDDQLSTISRLRAYANDDYLVLKSKRGHDMSSHEERVTKQTFDGKIGDKEGKFSRDSMLPVGSFSSFKVNLTYLVRKDFDQQEPQLIRILIDSSQFVVQQLDIINNGTQHISSLPHNEDYDFLSHKLLRDLNTRVTAINQIYEDWITRNFYTVVYIQRRLENTNESEEQTIVNDRLVFRGTSIALLGADQLDYSVKAAAFITEKNGLHYYLEFLNTGKFYLCAVDWTKRPFKIIDSKKFPIKATRTQLDNEELLLCPPAVCYSTQPVDEIISYGRISLPDKIQHEASILSMSLSSNSVKQLQPIQEDSYSLLNETNLIYNKQQNSSNKKELLAGADKIRLKGRDTTTNETFSNETTIISLDNVVDFVKAGSIYLQTRLHLRDWVWLLGRVGNSKHQHVGNRQTNIPDNNEATASGGSTIIETGGGDNSNLATKFELRYELARRNDIKVKPDTYGYVLTGHEIDASYRVYNELYLISANHLITINYTLANETVIHTHPIGEEFFGLSSTLLDPITGAFYDRYANQIYFFKADRYVGYDYATKKPLEEFLLQAPDAASNSGDATLLVSSLPVVGILGYQRQIDGVYHDFSSDFVYIFSGMKYYTFSASEFKNGTFKPETRNLPQMHCINERFLDGCNFDEAYPNPCHSSEDHNNDDENNGFNGTSKVDNKNKSAKLQLGHAENKTAEAPSKINKEILDFSEEQQTKLRKIATTRVGLLDLIGAARAIEPLISTDSSPSSQEKIFVYLLIAMVVLTVLVSIVMIVLIVNWTKLKLFGNENQRQELDGQNTSIVVPHNQAQVQLGNNYLSNQRQHHSNRHPYRNSRSSSHDRSNVKPLGSVSVVVSKSNRRHGHGVDNSAL